MACIYHIYSTEDPGTVYIGQTSSGIGQNGTYDRPLTHFSGVYSITASRRENEMFSRFIRLHPLSTMVIEIYDQSNLFGIPKSVYESFFNEWSIDGYKPDFNIDIADYNKKLSRSKRAKLNFATSLYLDAAEIIHNYVYRSKSLMTHQMGGQGHVFRSINGLVLNDTVTPQQAVVILNNNTDVIVKLQQKFNESFQKQFETVQIKGKTLLQAWAETAWVMSAKEVYWKELLDIAIPYLQIYIPRVRDTLDKMLPASGEFTLHNKMKNIYSEIENKFKLTSFSSTKKGEFNIIHAIVTQLNTNAFRNKVAQEIAKHPDNAQKGISKAIQDLFKNGLQGFIDGISFANFFELKYTGSQTKKQSWTVNSPSEVHIACNQNDNYGQSLRQMAYRFFNRCANNVLRQNFSDYTLSRKMFDTGHGGDGNVYYLVEAKHFSSAIHDYYRSNVQVDWIEKQWRGYLHQMLTIFTRNNGTTIGKPFKRMDMLVNTRNYSGFYGIVNQKLKKEDFAHITNDDILPAEDEMDGIIAFPAYQFSMDTWTDIVDFWDTKVQNIVFF